MLIAQKYGNDIFKLGGVQTSLDPSKYTNKKASKDQTSVVWKDASVEWDEGEDGVLRRWVDGRTGVP